VLKRLFQVAAILALVGVLAAGALAWWGYDRFTRPGPLEEETVVEIPRGAGLAQIAEQLRDAGVVEDALVFRVGVRALGDAYVFNRGIAVELLKETRRAQNLTEQVTMAADSTWGALTQVYTFLSKIGTQVPVTALGGPITIARVAGASAFEGPGAFLLFLTMLSANLAVLNFLPIPVLDGGHMVFLAWEGLRGRPAGERVVTTLTGAGMLFLLGFMAFIFALDLGIIPRGL